MAEDDVMVLVHGYLAGGFVGKDKCITAPDDVKGLQTRAAGKAFEQMLAGAGASIASMASSEIYNAMQTGVLTRPTPRPPPSCPTASTSRSLLHAGRRLCAVVHVSAAADEQVHLRRPDRGTARRRFWPLPRRPRRSTSKKPRSRTRPRSKCSKRPASKSPKMTQEEFDAWRALAQETSYKPSSKKWLTARHCSTWRSPSSNRPARGGVRRPPRLLSSLQSKNQPRRRPWAGSLCIAARAITRFSRPSPPYRPSRAGSLPRDDRGRGVAITCQMIFVRFVLNGRRSGRPRP
jgi:hypothetical protein